MQLKLKEFVKPSHFGDQIRLGGSRLQGSEDERVMADIIELCQQNADQWIDFSLRIFLDYFDYPDEVFLAARLEKFADNGLLKKNEDQYSVTEKCLRVLAEFIN